VCYVASTIQSDAWFKTIMKAVLAICKSAIGKKTKLFRDIKLETMSETYIPADFKTNTSFVTNGPLGSATYKTSVHSALMVT